jgi:hypothetical protein
VTSLQSEPTSHYEGAGHPTHVSITSDDAQYALDFVKEVCYRIGPGLPGTPQERERAAAVEKELEAHLGAVNVATEEFEVAQSAFIGSFLLSGLFTIAAALLVLSTGRFLGIPAWVTCVPALVLSIFPLFSFLAGFVFGVELIDSLFDKKRSVNIVGSLRPPGGAAAVKRLLIVSGHHDSAWENNWLRLPGYGFFVATATWLAGVVAVAAMAVVQFTGVITGDASLVQMGVLGWILIAYPVLPSAFFSLLYNTARKDGGNVPGAADNLSGCGVVVAMCRFLVRNQEYVPADTEIRFVTFGSEEAGLRGSRRYLQRHLDDLRRLDARVLNLEIVAYREIDILASEVNGTVKNSSEMVECVAAAAKRAGVPHRVKSAYLGVASDAGPFSRAGIKATTLLGFKFPQQFLGFYHQRRDGPQILSIEPFLNALKISLEWIRSSGE